MIHHHCIRSASSRTSCILTTSTSTTRCSTPRSSFGSATATSISTVTTTTSSSSSSLRLGHAMNDTLCVFGLEGMCRFRRRPSWSMDG